MLVSDIAGGAGGVLIAIPALKDQVYRFLRNEEQRKAKGSPWPGLRNSVRQAWETRRNEFDGFDSLATLVGALAITASFVLKLVDR